MKGKAGPRGRKFRRSDVSPSYVGAEADFSNFGGRAADIRRRPASTVRSETADSTTAIDHLSKTFRHIRPKRKCPGIAARAPSRRLRADPLSQDA